MIKIDLTESRRINLIRLMKKHGIKPGKLAERIGRDQPYITAIMKPIGEQGHRGIGKKILSVICETMGWDEGEFYKGVGFEVPEKIPLPIPVISWVHAGLFRESVDMWPVGISGEAEPVYSTKHISEFSFALRVEGDSMEPRFMNGDIIVVDPTQSCDNGCPCVVSINNEVSFKFFRETDDAIHLCPMNDKYEERVIRKESKVDFKVIGKVVDLIPKL